MVSSHFLLGDGFRHSAGLERGVHAQAFLSTEDFTFIFRPVPSPTSVPNLVNCRAQSIQHDLPLIISCCRTAIWMYCSEARTSPTPILSGANLQRWHRVARSHSGTQQAAVSRRAPNDQSRLRPTTHHASACVQMSDASAVFSIATDSLLCITLRKGFPVQSSPVDTVGQSRSVYFASSATEISVR